MAQYNFDNQWGAPNSGDQTYNYEMPDFGGDL